MTSAQDYGLKRRTNHLGNVQGLLGDLLGYDTLAHELIQNADDVKSASFVRFDVRDDALVVDNDGRFEDCERLDEQCG